MTIEFDIIFRYEVVSEYYVSFFVIESLWEFSFSEEEFVSMRIFLQISHSNPMFMTSWYFALIAMGMAVLIYKYIEYRG